MTKGLNTRYNVNDCYNSIINDLIVRRARMQGLDTLWVQTLADGGIKTQYAIEKNIRKSLENEAKVTSKETNKPPKPIEMPHHEQLLLMGQEYKKLKEQNIY